jgi:hypothetical protein
VCYDISGLPNGPIVRLWSSRKLWSNRSAPTLGATTNGGSTYRVFALGVDPLISTQQIAVVSIDPSGAGENRNFEMSLPLRPTTTTNLPLSITTWTSPAIGPSDNQSDPVNLLYCSTLGAGSTAENHFFTVYADNTPRFGASTPLAWSLRFARGLGFPIGTYASPSVYPVDALGTLANQIVIAADDQGLYGIPNRYQVDAQHPFAYRWDVIGGIGSLSETAALTASGEMLYRDEGDRVRYWADGGSAATDLDYVALHKTLHLAGPAVDGRRLFVATDATGDIDATRVHGICYELAPGPSGTVVKSWKYLPPTANLQQTFVAAIAINSDGTLISVNNGYIFALGHLRGDFNADGCRNNTDIDAFALALSDREAWNECYGTPGKVDLLAIGDCSHDGVVNNFDLDCNVALLNNDPYCGADTPITPCAPLCPPNGGTAAPQQSAPDAPEGGDMDHFWSVVRELYMQFGMESPW